MMIDGVVVVFVVVLVVAAAPAAVFRPVSVVFSVVA